MDSLVQFLTGIRLQASALTRLRENHEDFEFVVPDILKVQAKFKDLNIVRAFTEKCFLVRVLGIYIARWTQ